MSTPLTRPPLMNAIDTISQALNSVTNHEATFLDPTHKAEALTTLATITAQIAGLTARITATADDLATSTGHRDIASWLAATTRADYRTTKAKVSLAKRLDRRYPLLRAALNEGRVSETQTRLIEACLTKLWQQDQKNQDPEHALAPWVFTRAEEVLIESAATLDHTQLKRACTRVLDTIVPELAETILATRLEQEEAEAYVNARVTFTNLGDGHTLIKAKLPTLEATRLKHTLEALAAPHRHHPNSHPNSHGEEHGDIGDIGEWKVPHNQRLGHAFCELIESLDPATLPDHNGDTTNLIITIELEKLSKDLATTTLADHTITANQARRLACQAHLIPAILDTNSEVLDLGRSQRLFTKAQRRALKTQHHHCQATGCTIPATWCQAHHQTPWAHGGNTDLANAVLLCTWHHRKAHDRHYEHTKTPDGDWLFHRRN